MKWLLHPQSFVDSSGSMAGSWNLCVGSEKVNASWPTGNTIIPFQSVDYFCRAKRVLSIISFFVSISPSFSSSSLTQQSKNVYSVI